MAAWLCCSSKVSADVCGVDYLDRHLLVFRAAELPHGETASRRTNARATEVSGARSDVQAGCRA
jgi:hypothetical protein